MDWKWEMGAAGVDKRTRKQMVSYIATAETTARCAYIWTGNTIVLRIFTPDGDVEHIIDAKVRRSKTRPVSPKQGT